VLRHYREIVGIRDDLRNRLLKDQPDLFIGVDAPDFNLALEQDLREAGIKTVHFVCPSIWAWRMKRVEKLKRACDHVLCIFPFEPELLAKHGVAASYVGHPLADAIPLGVPRASARAALGLGGDDVVVAVLPGSRRGEIRHIAPDFARAALRLHAARPALRCLLPVAPGLRPAVEAVVAETGAQDALELVDGRSHEVLAACDAALVASGTATLEAALFKRPMVISYIVNRLSYRIMLRQQLQPWIGLPNILCGEFVVPELLQDAATPEALAEATLAWLAAPDKVQALQQRFTALHDELRRDTPTLCADAIQKVIAC